jgi:dolichol-phosphate mannosyltransferase
MKILVVPTFNEAETLPIFLKEILPLWNKEDQIIIADDSDEFHRNKIELIINQQISLGYKISLLRGSIKGGRGAAIRRAMEKLYAEGINFSHLIEADADGSHRAIDIIRLRDLDPSYAFVIGSRYLNDSQINGWSQSRRMLSGILNTLIPKVVGIQTSDITNGLRRYSFQAVKVLLSNSSINTGFIYLTEQSLYLYRAGIKATEVPIEFMPRVAGKSSVTLTDLVVSLSGLYEIWKLRRISK